MLDKIKLAFDNIFRGLRKLARFILMTLRLKKVINYIPKNVRCSISCDLFRALKLSATIKTLIRGSTHLFIQKHSFESFAI